MFGGTHPGIIFFGSKYRTVELFHIEHFARRPHVTKRYLILFFIRKCVWHVWWANRDEQSVVWLLIGDVRRAKMTDVFIGQSLSQSTN
jgi:hypothetical protein